MNLPIRSPKYRAYLALRYSELLREVNLPNAAKAVKFSDLGYFRPCKDCGTIGFSSSRAWTFSGWMGYAIGRATFSSPIVHIVSVRSLEQMGGVATGRVVAGMQDQQRMRVLPVVQKVGDSVNPKRFILHLQEPVSTVVTALPRPAFVWSSLINVFPETRNIGRAERWEWFTSIGHVGSSIEPIRLSVAGVSALATALQIIPQKTLDLSLFSAHNHGRK